MNLKSKIFLLRTFHIIGAVFLYFSIMLLIYSSFTGRHFQILPYSLGALLLEAFLVIVNKWDCPLHPIHKKLGDDKAFFGLFLPQKYERKAMIFSIALGTFSIIFYVLVKLIK